MVGCLKYPSVKLLNIVTWKEWYILVVIPNVEDEEERENTQHNNDEEK